MKEVEEEAAAGESPAARPSRNAGGTSFPRTTRRPRENLRRHVPPSDEDRRCPRREAPTRTGATQAGGLPAARPSPNKRGGRGHPPPP